MVQFNTKDNEILVKIVFYGTGLSGKTTNLQKLHEMTDPAQKTDLFSVNTMEDRTLFFDLLPLDLGYVYGNSIKLQIYTVPGQVHYDSTRRIVLSGADGVVFVADSDQAKLQENVQSINNLYHNLQANRLNIKEVPLVMQFNKRDLPNITPVDVMNQKLNFRNVPYYEAIAIQGEGVLETFLETVKLTVRYIFNKYQLSKNVKNVDSVIEKLESSILAKAKQQAEKKSAPPLPNPKRGGKTVLKYTHDYDAADDKGSQEKLLQKAITSNMETAQLYNNLKKTKEALVKKNEELQTLYKKIEKSNSDNLKIRRFLESLVNFAGEAIITFNEMWIIQNWNQSAEELFGYKREMILSKNVNVLFPKESMADLNRVLTYVMNGKVVRGFETRLKAKSGASLPVNITFSPIKNEKETIVAFTAIVRDLSFMTKVSGQLYSMQRYEAVCSVLPSLFTRINSTAQSDPPLLQMLELMNALSQPFTDVTEPTSINELIKHVHILLGPTLEQMRIGWGTQLFPSLPAALMDRQQMTRALLNLFLNAIDSLHERNNGKITIGTHHNKGEILLQIIDNGVGMDSAELDREVSVFEDEQKTTRGIRLNATKEIIKNNNGTIRIDSTPGKGTKITIRFSGG